MTASAFDQAERLHGLDGLRGAGFLSGISLARRYFLTVFLEKPSSRDISFIPLPSQCSSNMLKIDPPPSIQQPLPRIPVLRKGSWVGGQFHSGATGSIYHEELPQLPSLVNLSEPQCRS